jgi:hypothetical protein
VIVEYLRYTVPETASPDFEKAAAGHEIERGLGRYLVRLKGGAPFTGIEGFTPDGDPERYETTPRRSTTGPAATKRSSS